MKNRVNLIFGLGIVALSIPLFALYGLPQDEGEYVGNNMCVGCHVDMEETMAKALHGRLGPHEINVDNSCEACHGPGSAHAMSDGEDPIPHPFNEETAERDANAACASCHIGGDTMGWHDSEHAVSGTTCLDCHDVKAPYSRRTVKQANELCATCHAGQSNLFNLPSHHPVTEQQMACIDCHNPHGGEELMLRAESVNDSCLECHADKHGPFLYEHEPVTESCLICHNAHGAMHNNLLKAQETSLCLRCHAGHEDVHPNLSTPSRRAGYMTKCSRCHSQIHGSDLPGYIGPSRFIR
jgi:DmsE family decaheme c-type cytochrome